MFTQHIDWQPKPQVTICLKTDQISLLNIANVYLAQPVNSKVSKGNAIHEPCSASFMSTPGNVIGMSMTVFYENIQPGMYAKKLTWFPCADRLLHLLTFHLRDSTCFGYESNFRRGDERGWIPFRNVSYYDVPYNESITMGKTYFTKRNDWSTTVDPKADVQKPAREWRDISKGIPYLLRRANAKCQVWLCWCS
jgi:hypothetical protein